MLAEEGRSKIILLLGKKKKKNMLPYSLEVWRGGNSHKEQNSHFHLPYSSQKLWAATALISQGKIQHGNGGWLHVLNPCS